MEETRNSFFPGGGRGGAFETSCPLLLTTIAFNNRQKKGVRGPKYKKGNAAQNARRFTVNNIGCLDAQFDEFSWAT